jgi:hypothetical protein
MRFLVLMAEADHFDRWEQADDDHRQRCFDDYDAFARAVKERGTLVLGDALDHPGSARTLQPDEERTVTEGPYAETVEQLGGFYVVELPDLGTAVELARLLPREYTIEVRQMLGVEV